LSHIVTIQTKVHDPAAVTACLPASRFVCACAWHYPASSVEKATGSDRQASWLEYPAVIDVLTGLCVTTNFNGHWGDQQQLNRFLQSYAVEKTKLEARKPVTRSPSSNSQTAAFRYPDCGGS